MAALLPGCGGGGGGSSSRGTTPIPPTTSGVRISGTLIDDTGAAVSGASVTVGGVATTTGADGTFSASVGAVGASGLEVKLTARRAGHLDAFKTLTLYEDNIVNDVHETTVRMQRLPRTADEATRAQVTAADGSTQDIAAAEVNQDGFAVYETRVALSGDERAVTFGTPPPALGARPQASIQFGDATGAGANAAAVLGVTGDIIASVSYGDPTDATGLETFPGDFTVTENGVEQALITAGFVSINLTRGDGTPITQFAAGQTAKITMTIPAETVNPDTGLLMAPGDTIPIFVFNETTGEWVVERNADNSVKQTTVQQDNDGTLYAEFETSHLTWFNFDWKSEKCIGLGNELEITVVDGIGNPVNGATLRISSTSGWIWGPLTAPDNLFILFNAPRGITWQVWAEKHGLSSRVATITSCKDTLTGNRKFTLTIGEPVSACSADVECEDDNALTMDRCRNAGQVTAYCSHIGCTTVCDSNDECADGNASTQDTCVNPGTCQAYCSHTSCGTNNCGNDCTSLCSNNTDCNDGEQFTIDTCNNPGICEAACVNTPFTPECLIDTDCDDGWGGTTDVCTNPGLENAACVNAGIIAEATPTALTLIAGQAQSTLTCATLGTITQLQGRCDATESWTTILSGNTLNCIYTSKSTFTPGCLVNGLISDNVDTSVIVSNLSPSVAISASQTLSTSYPVDVAFTATCTDTDGACVSYMWDFGDGSPTSSDQNPMHTFTSEGNYSVTLTVTDNDGDTKSALISIMVTTNLSWAKTFGGLYKDEARSVQQTSDGGYIIAGYSHSIIPMVTPDMLIIKTDAAGNQTWLKSFGGDDYDTVNSVQQTNDGGYIIAGLMGSNGVDFWLLKTDADGNQTWAKTFGGVNGGQATSVQQTSDGGYIIVGITSIVGAGGVDILLVKTDAAGNQTWASTFGDTGNEYAASVQQTSDGGYIIAAYTDGSGVGGGEFWLIKTDAAGNQTWLQTYGGPLYDSARSALQTSDGGYIIVGYTSSFGAGSQDMWLVKTDAAGNQTWAKTFGGTGSDIAYSVRQMSDGGYIIAGVTSSFGATGGNIWLVRTDASGNQTWANMFGGANLDSAYDVKQTLDNNFIIAGSTNSFGAGDFDFWLLKTSGLF